MGCGPHMISPFHSALRSYRPQRSNPRLTSAARRTPGDRALECRLKSFNPRLTSAARRTMFCILQRPSVSAFQSAPHFSSEANGLESDKSDKAITFQSAPHFSSEANHSQPATYSHLARFQSAPHFSSEANAYQVLFCLLKERFQSAPHFSSEANVGRQNGRDKSERVSIRASLQQRGEPCTR